MKNKSTLTIQFKGLDEVEKDLLGLKKNKTPKIHSPGVVFFDSLNSFRNFMTLQKLELLAIISDANPKSIYELSQMVNRAIAPVQKDCQSLETAGFISLTKEKGGRGTLCPKLSFGYDRILVKLPEHPYELQFSAA